MRISPKQYAESLYQVVKEKKDSDIKVVIENFIKVLISNNDIFKIDEIIFLFEKIWNSENGIIKAEVVSAKKVDNEIIKLLNSYIAKLTNTKRVLINQKVDKNILGGVIIKYKDKILDGSLRMRLGELKKEMVR